MQSRNCNCLCKNIKLFWASEVESSRYIKNPQIDFIVTPKGGSPILGYEFAKLLNKPFVLHEEAERFICKQDDMRKKFDCAKIPKVNSRALIVDDSTTGGRMVCETVDDLRKYGYIVSECLVVLNLRIRMQNRSYHKSR